MSDRFRQEYKELDGHQKKDIIDMKAVAEEFEGIITLYENRESDLALRKLEEAVMWATKAISK